MQYKDLVFSCDYKFSPQGVSKLKNDLLWEFQKNGIIANPSSIIYDFDRYYFVLSSNVADAPASVQLFLSVLNQIIITEKKAGGFTTKSDDPDITDDDDDDDDDDDGKVNKDDKYLEHSTYISCRLPPSQEKVASTDVSGPQTSSTSEASKFPKEPCEDSHEKIWIYTSHKKNLDEIITDRSVSEIERLTGSKLNKDLNQQKIYIQSREENSCLAAYTKLDNLRKYFFTARPYVDHLFYSEAIENFKVSVFPITEVKKKRYETTLLNCPPSIEQVYQKLRREGLHSDFVIKREHQQLDYERFHSACVVICCLFDNKNATYSPEKADKLFAVVTEDAKQEGWMSSFKFLGRNRRQGEPGAKWEMGFETVESQKTNFEKVEADVSIVKPSQVQQHVHTGPRRVEEWVQKVVPYSNVMPQQLAVRSGNQVLNHQVVTEYGKSQGARNHNWLGEREKSSVLPLAMHPSTAASTQNQSYPSMDIAPAKQALAETYSDALKGSRPVNATATNMLAPTLQASPNTYSNAVRGNKLSHAAFPFLPGARFHSSQSTSPSPFHHGSTSQANPTSTPPVLSKKHPISQPTSITNLQPGRVSSLRISGNNAAPSPAISDRSTPEPFRMRGAAEETTLQLGTKSAVPSPKPVSSTVPEVQLKGPVTVQPANTQHNLMDVDQLTDFFSAAGFQENDMLPDIKPLVPERVQAISEVATRKFHTTMEQKKPNPSKGNLKAPQKKRVVAVLERPEPIPKRIFAVATPVDPLPEFLQKAKSSIYEMLGGLRGFQGEILVNAELGRIILRKLQRRDVTVNKDSPCTMLAEELQDILLCKKREPKDGPYAHFTNVLTTLPADAKYLIEMQGSNKQALWDAKPLKWDLWYELDCIILENGRKNAATIKINAEKFTYTIVEKHDLGTIFTHCVKRNWDVRVTATGYEKKPEHEKYAQSILDSLFVKEDTQPYLEFTSNFPAQFRVYACRVRNSCQYKANDNSKSVLNVTEVRELMLEYDSGTDSCQNYRACYPDAAHRRPAGKEDLWFEVNVCSTVLQEHFKENTKIEFGDEAAWTTQKLIADDVASAILEPALLMIKGADGVGFYNNNRQEKSTPAPARGGPSAKVGFQYW